MTDRIGRTPREVELLDRITELESQVDRLQNIKIPQMQAILNQAFDQRDEAEAKLDAVHITLTEWTDGKITSADAMGRLQDQQALGEDK